MAGVTADAFNYAMKHHFVPRIRGEVNRKNMFLRLAQSAEKTDMTGRSLIVKHKYARSAGIVMNSAGGGGFPTPTQSLYRESTIPWVHMLGSIGVSNTDMLRAKNGEYSLVQPLTQESKDLIIKMTQQVNHNFLKGDSLGTVASYTDGTPDVIVCDEDIYDILEVGMVLDFYRSGSPVSNALDCTIAAITGPKTFTVTSITGTPADGDTIHLANSYGNGAQSLADIISTSSSLQGVAATAYYDWQANDAGVGSATDFSPKTLKILLTKIVKRLGGRREGLHMVADAETYDVMGWVLIGNRSPGSNDKKFGAYWQTFSYDGIPILKEYDAPANTLYVVDKNGLLFGVLGGELISIVDGDGSTKRLQLSSSVRQDSWEMDFTSYAQLGCTERYGHGKYLYINNLADGSYDDLGGFSA